MELKIRIDDKPVINTLHELGEGRQAQFILSRSLNLMAKEIQKAERENLRENLKINRPWVLSQVKINKGSWATKKRLRVTIETSPQVSFLFGLDKGLEHLPINGRKFLLIPNDRVFRGKPISRDNPLKVKNLNLHQTKYGLRGDNGTFVLNPKSGETSMLMQRVAKDAKGRHRRGKSKSTGLRVLYFLKRESFRPKRVSWGPVAEKTFQSKWSEISTQVMREALASTRSAVKSD